MKAPLAYASLGAACAVVAVRTGGVGWVLLWPAAAFAYVAALYPLDRPGGWGKRPDGTLRPAGRVLLAPVRWTLLALWHASRRGRRAAMNEVHPKLWLSRRPLTSELPPSVGLVIDLTSELSPARGVIGDGRNYLAVPTLDYAPPPADAASAALGLAQRHLADPAADRPAVLIHCAGGIGRSTTLMAALLVRLGVAGDVAAAVKHIRRTRPAVKLTPAQQARAAALAAA